MVVAVTGISAYPTGVAFTLSTRSRTGPDRSDPAWQFPVHRGRQFRDGVLDPEPLRSGIEFADGRKATNLEMLRALHERQAGAQPVGPVLQMMGGGGDGWRWDQRHWLWPLPPAGPLAFVCEWPAHGIALTRTEVDAGLLIDAASRAQVFWDEPGASPGAPEARMGHVK